MHTQNKTQISKDLAQRTLVVSRQFNYPVNLVWKAFTQSEFLSQWWAPIPFKAETKEMDFRVGGHWLYAMVDPEGNKHWGKTTYLAIETEKYYDLEDCFCDENGIANAAFPTAVGKNKFIENANGTLVEWTMTYPSEEDLLKVIEMGMEQGITMCMDQLEQLFIDGKIHI